ncbi:MAG: anhydro-N-acetylmuramic acid kinase [Methylotenera sp.]|nr:anhydro-N-acetylmuramic acid kinase [Methylotenera sp.]
MASQLFIGLMSGTSLDGIDAALVEFDSAAGSPLKTLNTHFLPYSAELRSVILRLQHPTDNELETTALISNQLAKLFASAVKQLLTKAKITSDRIVAIGCHGQTIRHQPGLNDGIGFTMQIGNAALLAELTDITVVADFRSRDIAAGGQGAPLVPAFHHAVFSSNDKTRALINIGGIANITYLAKNEVFGFDTGPGNMLLDAWIKRHQGLDYDADGAWARTGEIIKPLLSTMLTEAYLALLPPKSTGRDLFNEQWLDQHLLNTNYLPQDVARTLVAFTVQSIADSLQNYCGSIDETYLCGGGAHNTLLKSELQKLLTHCQLATTETLGIGVDWVEAIAFAWLAKQCLDKKTANLPQVTGANAARILGAIYQR